MKDDELLAMIFQRLASLGNGGDYAHFQGLFHALYSERYNHVASRMKSQEILSLLLKMDLPKWFANGKMGYFWTIRYLGKMGLVELVPSLMQCIKEFLVIYRETWGKIPWKLHPEKDIYGEGLLLSILWCANDKSYERYAVEEMLIMSIDNMEEMVDSVLKDGERFVSLGKWLCICYLIEFTARNRVFTCKSNAILNRILSMVSSLTQEWILPTKLLFQDKFSIDRYFYKQDDWPLPIFDSAVLALVLNCPHLFYFWRNELGNNPALLKSYECKELIGAGLGIMTILNKHEASDF